MVEILNCEGLISAPWSPNHRQSSQNTVSGASQPIRFGDPFWTVDLSYSLTEFQFRGLTAQFNRLDGAIGQMEIWRMNRQRPVAIPGADASTVTAFSVTGDVVTITTNGGALGLGDMLSYDAANGRRWVGELSEITGGSGNQVVGKCLPPIVAPAGSPNAIVYQAYGLFRMVPETYKPIEPIGTGLGSLTVTMRQVEP